MSAPRPVVAVVTDTVPPYVHGGKEMRCREVVVRLQRDADVRVFTMRWWPGPRTRVVDGVEYIAICPKVDLYHRDCRSLAEAAVFGLATLRLATARFDAVEADHIPYTPLFVLRAVCLLRRKRLVATWHEVWGPQLWREYLGPRYGRLAWWVERAAMLMPDAVVAASPQTADRLAPYVRRRTMVAVAPNGLDLDLITRVPPAAPRTDLVHVGRMLPHKHADLVLESMALLRDQGLELTCRLIGRGPERPRLQALARHLHLTDAVEFRDDVDDQVTLYGLLKAADVFVFPSVREGSGIAVLEALACGLPVVTTNAPDNHSQSLVTESGYGVVCPPTPDAIATAIRRSRELARESREHIDPDGDRRREEVVRRYGWDTVAGAVASALGVTRG